MLLRISVADAATGVSHDVEVTGEPDSTVGSLLAALPVSVGDRPCFVGAEPLEPRSTLAESPLVAGATVRVGAEGPRPRQRPFGAVGALRVVSGPDAGTVAWLRPGAHLLARDTRASVTLRDPEVSRRHARLEIADDGTATLADLGSRNGTSVDGTAATERVPLGGEAVADLGDDRVQWVPATTTHLRTVRSPDGRLDFDRAFAPVPAVTRTEVVLPQAEGGARNVAAVLVSALVPLALGGVMAAVLRQPTMLLFALLGPLAALGTRFVERRQRAARQRDYLARRRQAERALAAHVDREQRVRRARAPDPVDVALAATGAGRRLWPRNVDSADGLLLRVGVADAPASVDLQGEPWPGFETPTLRDVPVTVDLRDTGVLGVVGRVEETQGLLRSLVAQLTTLRSPDDLRLVVITSADDDELGWTAWLPHSDAGTASHAPAWVGNTRATRAARVAELKELVALRTAARRGAADLQVGEEVVLVLDGALALRHLPGMEQVLREGPSVGVYTICVDRHDMNECRGLCELDRGELRLTRRRDDEPSAVRPEVIGRETAEHLARALTPMRDRLTLARGVAAIPYPVRFLDLLGVGTPTGEDVAELWARHDGPTTEVPLGLDASGPVTVDLARQGPHTMLGGATGAGKSILLQTLVTSLLLANRPDELNLVLVDFKGGSAFLPFERCPHVVGLIRSTGETPADVFDEAAAKRVLASVRAEVRRRESLLARYGGEIDEYWRARRTARDLQPLPRLVMVFDEFARVLETSPDFLKELVNVAAKGRSLGMHLVLATQSLQGKLSAELKNNIDLRITLRQNEPADSVEVLGVPDAATIPGRLRGRGMIVCTKDETRTPRPFQSGYLGAPPPLDGAAPAQVRIVEWSAVGEPRPEETVDHGDAATDQALAIAAVEEAAAQMQLPAPFRPLLPPLPAQVPLDDLTDLTDLTEPADPSAAHAGVATLVPFGLADDPAAQAQPVAALDLAGTDRLLVAGGPQSGRTTFARALMTSLAGRCRPDEAHLYVVEQRPSGLAEYADLPHCGGVMSPAEPDRIRRFVTWLDGEVQRRATARFTRSGAPEPAIVVLVDGWEHFDNRSDPTFVETSLLPALRGVITAGAPLGVHVVAIGGQDMMSGKLPSLFSRRLLLGFPKEETRRQHVPSDVVSPPVLPGRAVSADAGHHVQVGWPSASVADLVARASSDDLDPGRLPQRFESMPLRVRLDQIVPVDPPPAPTWLPIGVGGVSVDTVGVDPFEAGPHLLLVSGPAGSGRTTAAATIVHGVRRVGAGVLVLTPPRSPLRARLPDDDGVRVVCGTTVKDVELREAAAAFGDGPYAVVVDDCDQVTLVASEDRYSEEPTLLAEIAEPGALGHRALALCGDAGPILSGQRRSMMRVVNEMMSSGARILLTPTSSAVAREHGFALEPDQFFAGPPGRGFIATGRSAAPVHLASPDGAAAPPPTHRPDAATRLASLAGGP